MLKSLANEKQRWEAGSETFRNQMATIIGDVLLSSAFMAYAGNVFILKDFSNEGVTTNSIK